MNERKLERIVPNCPYCKKKLGKIEKNGKRWCVRCMMWMNEDGSKMKDGEADGGTG